MTDLLPCPFCGEKRVSLNDPHPDFYRYGSINCPACLVVMPGEVSSQDELIGCWNTRARTGDGAQPVAWRYRHRGDPWSVCDTKPEEHVPGMLEVQPLYAAQPPAAPADAYTALLDRQAQKIKGLEATISHQRCSAGSGKPPTYHEVLTRLDGIQNLTDAEDAAEWVMQLIAQPQPTPVTPKAMHWLGDRENADETRHAVDTTGCVLYFDNQGDCLEFMNSVLSSLPRPQSK